MMADFNTTLVAQDAMRKSVDSIFADAALTNTDRVEALLKNAEDYAQYLRVPLDHALGFVTKVANDAGAEPSVIRKVADPHGLLPQRRGKLPHEKEDFGDIEPDAKLIGEEGDPREEEREPTMRQSTKETMLKVARADFANHMAKIRATNPDLSVGQARSIYFSQNPGLHDSMRKWASPGDDLAKRQPSSAQIEVAAKTAEIKKAHPELTGAQAYTKAIETTPGLMKRLLAAPLIVVK